MHPDPDDTNLKHSHYMCRIPTWCAATAPGRSYARWRVGRIVRRELAAHGYTRTGKLCFHFGMVDGVSAVIAHFTARDALATAFEDSEAPR